VARSFERAIDAVIELAPDVILFAGDIFHVVRPSNQAILHAFIHFSRLMHALPKADVVMVAGGHDTPRTADTGCILQLFSRLGMYVVDREAQRLTFPDRDLAILAVPAGHRPAFTPDPAFTHNVLLVHDEVQGVVPAWAANTDRAAAAIDPRDLAKDRWSYVALGHYHLYREVAPNAFYAGSIDYTSLDTWGELHEQKEARIPGKGFIVRDLATGKQRFHRLPESRPLIDLRPISARGLTVAEVDEAIRRTVESCEGGIDDKIVRLRVYDLPRHVARELDHRAVREYKRRALHFQLDARRPELARPTSVTGAPRRRLHELVRDHLLARVIDADIDRESLVKTGVDYLDQAEVVMAGAGTLGSEES
jgi:exonuclease SbcD